MAAERMAVAGLAVTVFDRMPSPGRKLLIAGRGGLNLTHNEPLGRYLGRYGAARPALDAAIRAFPPEALRAWSAALGQETFVGSSGRVFPMAFKATPLLRAWLDRLAAQGMALRPGHRWLGWDATGALRFVHAGGEASIRPAATVLALGGASWSRLGSDGAWAGLLRGRGVRVHPFRPSNCGFLVPWSEAFRARFEGAPLKRIALGFEGRTARGEAVVTADGIEGGAVYALSAPLRDALSARGRTTACLDLRPDLDPAALAARLAAPRRAQSLSNWLRKAAGLPPVAIGLLREAGPMPDAPGILAARIKGLPLSLVGTRPLDQAISSAGGLALDELDDRLMLRRLPGVFAAGEMLDWEAPTGGYLLQAAFSTGWAAGEGVAALLGTGPAGRIAGGPALAARRAARLPQTSAALARYGSTSKEAAMSDNPLEMTPERQGRIDARATQMWEADGSPAGGIGEYRERADELIRMEDAGNPGQLPNPMTQDEPIPGVTVEEAQIQDNLGEFPGASGKADQGEFRNAPATREAVRDGQYEREPNPGGEANPDVPS